MFDYVWCGGNSRVGVLHVCWSTGTYYFQGINIFFTQMPHTGGRGFVLESPH